MEVVELEVRGQTLLKPLPRGESLLPEPNPCSGITSVGAWAPFVGHLSPYSHLPGMLCLSHR